MSAVHEDQPGRSHSPLSTEGRAVSLEAWDRAADPLAEGAGDDEKLAASLRFSVLAPSGHNTQPWAFRVDGRTVDVLADRSRRLPVVDPQDRELTISCGAALAFFEVATARYGLATTTSVWPDGAEPDLVARVEVGPACPSTDDDRRCFEAGLIRRTNRLQFGPEPVSEAVLDELVRSAAGYDVALVAVPAGAARDPISELVGEGDRIQASDRSFRKELAAWIRPNTTSAADGMPGYAFGFPTPMSFFGGAFLRYVNWGKGIAKAHARAVQRAPIVAVLATRHDDPNAWVATGRAIASVSLRAGSHGVSLSFFNQPVEIPELRSRLAALVCPGHEPQLVIRLGVGPDARATPRRCATDVTITASTCRDGGA